MNQLLARLTLVRALILGFFFASLYYFFLYDNGSVQTNAIQAANNEKMQQQKLLQDLNQKLDRAHEYQRSAADMGEALNRLLSYIPENYRLQDFMKLISEEAKVAGLNIVRISDASGSSSNQGHPEFEAFTVAVDLEGSFAQSMMFLSNLTKEKQIFILDKFRIDRQQDGGGAVDAPMLNFRGNIKAYRYAGGKSK